MKTITVSFGPRNSRTKGVNDGYTIGCLRRDREMQASLGYGDNVKYLVDGVAQDDDVELDDGDSVVVETNVGTKA